MFSAADELGAQVRLHRPANHAATPRIDDDGQIQEPAHVGTYVISATHNWSGPEAVKCRSSCPLGSWSDVETLAYCI